MIFVCFSSLKAPLFAGCDQLWIFFNYIAELCDQQYLWNKSSDIWDFLHGDSHQEKLASEITTFGWVSPVVLLTQWDYRIYSSSICLAWKESIDTLVFFAWRYSSREGSIWDYHFRLREARCVSHPVFAKEPQHPQKNKNVSLLFSIQCMNYEKILKLVSMSMKIVYS